ncbi:MAG TPA: hypothetical protein VJ859_13135 [Allosphingosinicella sp.]|nr:hypothetical protein [Allosphingosinicella sp.]
MKRTTICGTAALFFIAAAAVAEDTATPVQATLPGQVNQISLPANSEVVLRMNEDLTTKGGKIEEGTTFRLSVANDVMLGQYVVIPRGTPATGEITWKTGKGAFGKSGKMEIDLRSIDLNGRRIAVTGHYRQEGEGNTVGTVAGVVAAGVFAGFITGHSARIPAGRELKAYTTDALPVALPAGAPPPVLEAVVATAAAAVAPAAAATPTIASAAAMAPTKVSTPDK